MIILEIIVVGVVATATLDIWQQIYRLLFGAPITDWAIIGRWAAAIPRGRVVHHNIGKEAPVAHERALGWAVHYAVGIGYAVVYLFIVLVVLNSTPDFVSAIIFGAVSVCVTWFVMEPILGAGMMAGKTPAPAATMAHDFTSHLAFGLGLFIGAVVFRVLFGGA